MHFEKKGAGEPVILLHGLGASSFSWRNTAKLLSERFTTYAVDLLGFGRSDAPTGFDYSAEAQADAITALIRTEGLSSPHIIGHSMGGAVALYLAVKSAQTTAPPLGQMVLVASVAWPRPSPGASSLGELTKLPSSEVGPVLSRKILEAAYANASRVTDEQVDGYAGGLSLGSQIHAFLEHSKNLNKISFSDADLKAIKVNTLLIWGRQDNFVPIADGAMLETKIPDAKLQPIDDCGHIPQEEQAEVTGRLIAKFLV